MTQTPHWTPGPWRLSEYQEALLVGINEYLTDWHHYTEQEHTEWRNAVLLEVRAALAKARGEP